MQLRVRHLTTYNYDAPVGYGLQQVRLTPKSRPGQQILEWDMSVEGGKKELQFSDQHANQVDLISIVPDGHEVVIRCEGLVDVDATDGIVGQHRGFMPLWSFRRPTTLTEGGRETQKLLDQLGDGFSGDIERAHALSAMILEKVPYAIGQTHAGTTAEEAIAGGGGVCQDHAHIFITAMRKLGHPARYVSGYLMMNDREEQDATHAWAEAHFDGVGWIGFDISNGYSPDERYIRVATGLDYREAAPVSGMRYGGTTENMVVQLQVQQ
ncbi:Transglutaminase-like enzyme, putative cysteine protease [Parasphingorhabdus marina DSM 22363]|uniref:Transglutaminase-like enzyme, putative cysteine protease n=1 Tax=Parasphingorhabdus marina DSM 22363 TaxID=1123272 RepID=A0A1N6H3C7_9SPHN|nr:transglutaminase family protein [Parasphingorhabdus marina]SIO14280.1 Transglutaminase-like enzyme, putative cysteine protease [Parasphingorhabdus marina DSM 22363]